MIDIVQHAFGIIGVRGIDRPFVLHEGRIRLALVKRTRRGKNIYGKLKPDDACESLDLVQV